MKAAANIEVRYAETDQMGIVHHSNYLVWCELARTKLINELGFNYKELEEQGILSPVTNVNLDYKAPSTYGDVITAETWIEAYDGLRVTYGYNIINQKGILCVKGTTTHVCIRKNTFRPISIKKHLPDWHEKYERVKKQVKENV
ncbi:acyl-CoA thioesterase [Bacillus sp. FJAT-44742]|uniref:acyl-CoA thioesterase n=1 Tax=Bacillus sp. FJAT-44742 TaxID=2014005 RepID=UPI000C23C81D|nr:thioesterase family protein [Bacillus sp. FJAT-44742]